MNCFLYILYSTRGEYLVISISSDGEGLHQRELKHVLIMPLRTARQRSIEEWKLHLIARSQIPSPLEIPRRIYEDDQSVLVSCGSKRLGELALRH